MISRMRDGASSAVPDHEVAVVGGGIAGLAAAFWLEHDHGIRDLVVIEADAVAGGKVRSRVEDGYTLEWGPQGFLDNAPDTLELARLAGLGERLVRADEAAADRFILRAGRLRRIPLSPARFLASDVLPLPARLRVLGEPFARRRPETDESVYDFARRRIGRGAAEILVDAMVTGVFAGDSRQLSLAATFPKMAAMEAEFGSLTRAMIAKARQARRAGTSAGGPAGPGGTLTTFAGGMGELPAALAGALGERLLLRAPVRSLRREGSLYRVHGDGIDLTARRVIVAAPAGAAADILAGACPAAAEPLGAIPTAPITVVMAAYGDRGAFGRPVSGFGFLVPGRERAGILGCLYCHDIFPGQAPPGRLLLRTMLGGARDPEGVDLDDEATLGRVDAALARVFGRQAVPSRTWIIRHRRAIAQYTIGHLERVAAAEAAAAEAGIVLTGSSYHGVSVNDCIRQAREAARRAAELIRGR